MSILNRPINELDLVATLLVALLTMLLLFDRDFGLIYIAMIIVWFVFYVKDKLFFNKEISFPVERNYQDRLMDTLLALAIYAGFLLVSSIFTNLLNPGAFAGTNSLLEVVRLMSVDMYQASTPILKDSIFLMIIGWGIIIPIIETSVTGKIFESLYDKLRNKSWLAILLLCLIIGAGFAILHLTSKSGDSTSLLITFIFFTLTAYLIYWKKSLYTAIIMHVIANTLAVGFPLLFK